MDPRNLVAREAARLLYQGIVNEYKQAKEQASKSLGIESLPSNHEVAIELDSLSTELEGEEKNILLKRMRELALKIMKILTNVNPVLRGSVWRGTAHRGSDIDIDVYTDHPNEVKKLLEKTGLEIIEFNEVITTHQGNTSRSTHIKVKLPNKIIGEVVVRPIVDIDLVEACDIYGDLKRGLNLKELEKIMMKDSLRKFVPKRRYQ